MGPGRISGTWPVAKVTRLRACASHVSVAAVALAIALALPGCNSQPDPTEPASTTAGAAKPSAAAQGDMVAAFSANRPQTGLVDLKFLISKRPQVGEPVEIELALTPAVQLEGLFARFQAAEGLQLISGAETQHLEHPATGVPVGHHVTVLAKADGIYYLTAVVLADSEKESVARTFSIPIIAGLGQAEAAAEPPAASVADPKRAPARP